MKLFVDAKDAVLIPTYVLRFSALRVVTVLKLHAHGDHAVVNVREVVVAIVKKTVHRQVAV